MLKEINHAIYAQKYIKKKGIKCMISLLVDLMSCMLPKPYGPSYICKPHVLFGKDHRKYERKRSPRLPFKIYTIRRTLIRRNMIAKTRKSVFAMIRRSMTGVIMIRRSMTGVVMTEIVIIRVMKVVIIVTQIHQIGSLNFILVMVIIVIMNLCLRMDGQSVTVHHPITKIDALEW